MVNMKKLYIPACKCVPSLGAPCGQGFGPGGRGWGAGTGGGGSWLHPYSCLRLDPSAQVWE